MGKHNHLYEYSSAVCQFMLNNHVGIIYFGVFTGMEGYSKMTRLWGVRLIHDTPVLDDGFTNRG